MLDEAAAEKGSCVGGRGRTPPDEDSSLSISVFLGEEMDPTLDLS